MSCWGGTSRRLVLALARRPVVTKTSTGIVGLPVDPHARTNLIALSEKILVELKGIPEDAFYRQSVESIVNYRLKTLQSIEDEEAIEEEIGMGQLEELIEQAEDELSCIADYKEAKMWEVMKELNPPEFKTGGTDDEAK
ncbi:hypothetical protein CTAYLR_005430 [Chrysophaeum taylorii]|uniref:Uncharacterized protein n=1 Tax=Chrysophaeum taylorii TaxID=2483200 RepID=A0AAD7XPS1_9STRA|nr:hypothetical protein CTAYLR_005430 [Chrysophaeum taylorii]